MDVIFEAGTRVHSLVTGRHLVTFAIDFRLNDYLRPAAFKDWSIPVPRRGEPIDIELHDSLVALARAYQVRTGVRLTRLDTGEFI